MFINNILGKNRLSADDVIKKYFGGMSLKDIANMFNNNFINGVMSIVQ
jgi:hypothetical protein